MTENNESLRKLIEKSMWGKLQRQFNETKTFQCKCNFFSEDLSIIINKSQPTEIKTLQKKYHKNQSKVSTKKTTITLTKTPQVVPKPSNKQVLESEVEELTKMQVQFCDKKDHHQNPLNLVCLHEDCEFKGVLCSFCLIEKHSSHVQKCVPLKNVFRALNKINNPKTKEELGFIGCDILKQHCYLFSQFRRYISAIQDSIKSLEQAIEQKMMELQQESQLFVGNLLEKSLEKLNDPNCNAQTIQGELQKLFPLLQISPYNGEVECLGDQQKLKEAERVTKSAELLERECRFWMEKSLEDLKKLESNILIASRRRPIFKLSESRFGGCHNGWTLSETEAVSFEINNHADVWLNGFGLYEITKWPQSGAKDRDGSDKLKIELKLYQGGTTAGKVIHEETISITKDMEPDFNHIIQVNFSKALKLETKQKYTISMKPNKECISYYGFNGTHENNDFSFQDTIFPKNVISNSSCILHGQFPVFYFEE